MSGIHQMTYQSGGPGTEAVEVLTFDRLRQLNDGHTQRADFHVLALVSAGCGTVTIDFVQHPATRHTAVWIAPGVVHRRDTISDVVGELVLLLTTARVTPATRALVASPDLAARWQISDEDWPLVDAARNHLVVEATAAASSPPTELPQIVLSALVARLRPPRARPTAADPTFQLFRTSVEMHFRTHHDVGPYARTPGYAPRTVIQRYRRPPGGPRRRTSWTGSSSSPHSSSPTTGSPPHGAPRARIHRRVQLLPVLPYRDGPSPRRVAESDRSGVGPCRRASRRARDDLPAFRRHPRQTTFLACWSPPDCVPPSSPLAR